LKVSRVGAQLDCSINQLHATLIGDDVQRLQKLLHMQPGTFSSESSLVLTSHAQIWS